MTILEIETRLEDGSYVIDICGELDMDGCPALDKALEEAERDHQGPILVNLEELTFIDAMGLQTLLAASRRAASNGNRLSLTRGQGEVARLFRLTAVDRTLPFVAAEGI